MRSYLKSNKTKKFYVPHGGQWEIHQATKRFRVAICGRRWGKTLCALHELITFMMEHPGCFCFWVVPKYKELIPISEIIREWFPKALIRNKFMLHKTYRYIEILNGSQCWFHSAEDPDSLRGPGLDFVVLEEAAQLKETTWTSVIRPELLDSGGSALIITTPFGKNWVYAEYLRGQDPFSEDHISWQRTTYENPNIDRKLIEEDKKSFPDDIFRQEYLAQFVEGAGTTFRGIRNCFQGKINEDYYNVVKYKDGMRLVPKQPIKDKLVFIGIDLGKQRDFTVFIALDEEGNLVGFERFNRIDWAFQRKRLISFLKSFPRRFIMLDARGPGDPFYDDLKKEDIFVEPVKLTNITKREIIENLSIKLDEKGISGPFIQMIVEELEAFSYRMSHSGNIIYEAPKGFHDDVVLALAMAASKLRKIVTDWISTSGKGYLDTRLSS